MDAIQKLKVTFFIFIFFCISNLTAQVKNINDYLSQVNTKVNRINQMANNKQVIEAMNLLNETRRDFDTYLNYYFENEMNAARPENSDFRPQLNVQFSSVLTALYWESRVEQAQKSLQNAKDAFASGHHRRTLDAQDEVWSYLKTICGVGKMIKDVADNVSTGQFYDAVSDAKEGIDEFIENYKEIENSRLQIIETEAYETNLKTLIRRAELMEEKNWQFASFMRAYEQDVKDFYTLIERFNQKVNQIQNEAVINWSSPEYSWNKQTWLNQVNDLARDFKASNFNYFALKQKITTVNEQAESEKNKVYQNIQNSGANDAFDRGIKLDEEFDDFYNSSIDVLDECYLLDQQREKENKNTDVLVENIQSTDLHSQKIRNNQSNISATPQGSRGNNKLYHGYWGYGGKRFHFIQNMNSVTIDDSKKGTVQGDVLVCDFIDEKGDKGTDKYTLLGDGYKMKAQLEWTEKRISDKLLVENNFTAPNAQQIADFKAKNKYKEQVMNYMGSTMAQYNDADQDEVPDKSDKCPSTSPGLTVSNGGVTIQGCEKEITNTVSSNSSVTAVQHTERKPANSDIFAGAEIGSQPQTSVKNQKQNSTSVQKQNNTTASTSSNSSGNPEKVSQAVNKMPKTGASGMARIPVYKLKENDKLVFKQTGGTFLKFRARWSGRSFSEVLFDETKQIVYSTAELMAKRPEKAMFLDFQVNQYSDVYCYMEAWVLPGGVPIPADWGIDDNSHSSTGGATASNNFYDYIKKANEAFNRKYWNESQGLRASSNPKQESLDLLRKCEPIIAREKSSYTKYEMIKTLSDKFAEYGKRIFAYTAKSDFIQRAGSLLSKYGSEVNSVEDATLKADGYKTIAEGWRNLTMAATWGEHQYNKMYCDKQAKKYYDYALREDQNNKQLQKTVEKINAPKKPIPAKVAQTPAIPEEKWSVAENLRNTMASSNIDEAIFKEEKPNYSEVGVLQVNIGSGDVWIMVSGADEWQKIRDNSQVVFPGDKIKTGENVQNVSFTYSRDNSYLTIKSGAVITIYEEQLCIQRGDVYVNVTKKGDEFLVVTPTAVTGPRGTEFSVNVSSSGQTNVHLYEGAIELRNASEISYLVPGEKASIHSESEEIATQKFNIQQHKMQNWNTINARKKGFSSDKNLFGNVSGGGQIVGGQ